MKSTNIAVIGMFVMFAMLMFNLLFIGIPVQAATFTVIDTPTLNNVKYAAIMAHDNDSLTMLIKNPGNLYTGQVLHLEQRINILCLFD